MEELREKQIEALETVCEYNVKLVKGIQSLIEIVHEEETVDTEFLSQVIEGINWVIQVTNLTLPLLNENHEKINKDQVSNTMNRLSSAISDGEYPKIADILQNGVLLFLEDVDKAAKETIAA